MKASIPVFETQQKKGGRVVVLPSERTPTKTGAAAISRF